MTTTDDALRVLEESLRGAPIIWKGDYPYFIHPISDGIPRMDPHVLKAATDLIVETTDWEVGSFDNQISGRLEDMRVLSLIHI